MSSYSTVYAFDVEKEPILGSLLPVLRAGGRLRHFSRMYCATSANKISSSFCWTWGMSLVHALFLLALPACFTAVPASCGKAFLGASCGCGCAASPDFPSVPGPVAPYTERLGIVLSYRTWLDALPGRCSFTKCFLGARRYHGLAATAVVACQAASVWFWGKHAGEFRSRVGR
jgi:hypothetical protein